MANIIFIDNQDSFSYNLVDEFKKLRYNVTVFRNTVPFQIIEQHINAIRDESSDAMVVFSPGPGSPSQNPLMGKILDNYVGTLPILGICLGHQAIAEYFGAKIVVANEIMHGKATTISCVEHPIFAGLGTEIVVARYHSLVAAEMPNTLSVIGQFAEMPMAIISEEMNILGFQFHPESILTLNGTLLLQQSIQYLISNSTKNTAE